LNVFGRGRLALLGSQGEAQKTKRTRTTVGGPKCAELFAVGLNGRLKGNCERPRTGGGKKLSREPLLKQKMREK